MGERKKNKLKKAGKTLLSLLVFVLVWQLTAMWVDKSVYYPTFTETFSSFCQMARTGSFWTLAGLSLLRVLFGFALAFLLGVLLAAACSLLPAVTGFVKTVMGVAKATPVASFIILAMIWFQSSSVPVFIAVLMITPIIFENTYQGIQSIDKKTVEMCRVYRVPALVFLRKVAIPYAKPYLVAGVFTSLGMGFKAVVSAEILARPPIGIGTSIYDAKIYLETPQLFALTITVILLCLGFEKLIGAFLRRAEREAI